MTEPDGSKSRVRGLFRRPDSKFWWIQFATDEGKVRESTGTASKKLAIQILSKRRTEVAEGRFLDKKRQPRSTLGELVNWYLKRPNCGVRDKFTSRPILDYFGAHKRFSDIKAKDLLDYRQFRLTQQRRQGDRLISQASVNRELAFISAIANVSINAGLIAENPARGIKKFPERKRTRILTREETERLLAACKEGPEYLYPLVFCAITTGSRKGSLLELKWDDLDFRLSLLTLRKTKGGYERRIPLSRQTVDVLKNIPRRSEYVFTSTNGSPVKDVRMAFTNALKRANVKGMVFHSLRHCFGSMLAEQGIDAITIKSLLGHRTLDMSLIYTHISDVRLKNAVDLLPNLSARDAASEEHGTTRPVEKGSRLDHVG